MKITPAKIPDFLANIRNYRVILLHGPDQNKIATLQEKIIAQSMEADVQKIPVEILKNQPNFLYESIFAIDWLQNHAWKILILEDFNQDIEMFQSENWPNVLVIIHAKNNKNALFKFAEKEKFCATIGCYSEYDNQNILRKILVEENLQFNNKILTILLQRIPMDEQIIRSELQKLKTIMHPRMEILENDLIAITNYAHNEMMDLAMHFANLDFPNFERCAHELHHTGENPISLLHILYNFCEKLFWFKSAENKTSRNIICKKFNIFFKLIPILEKNQWSWKTLSNINDKILQLEIDLKNGQDLDYFIVQIRILMKKLKK